VATQSAVEEGRSLSDNVLIVMVVLGGVGLATLVVVLVVVQRNRRRRAAVPAVPVADGAGQPATEGAAGPSQFELLQRSGRFSADRPREDGAPNPNVKPG
jgi:hypothetical protein